MSKNVIVISCEYRETRVALIENGIIAELHIERKGNTKVGGAAGDVYLGKVTRVLPGLQAAFVDIGLERAAFLHVEDLIRPDDFETYLAGGRKHARSTEAKADGDDDTEEEVPLSDRMAMGEIAALREAVVAAAEDATTDLEDTVAEAHAAAVAAVEAEADGAGPFRDLAASMPSMPDLLADVDENDGAATTFDLTVSDPDVADQADPDSEDEVIVAGVASEDVILAAASNLEADLDGEALEDEDDVDGDHGETDGDEADASEADASDTDASEADASDTDASDADASDADTAEIDAADGDDAAADEGTDDVHLAAAPVAALDDLDMTDLPGFTVSEPGEPTPKARVPRVAAGADAAGNRGSRGRGRGRRGRGRGRGNEKAPEEPAPAARAPRAGRTSRSAKGGGAADRSGMVPGRISKSTPIREVVREGQEIIVQITKEPIGTKGARCSSHISLPGRYVVYLPTVEHVGVSKRIGSDRERARLRETIASMKPPTGGLIVRTLAEGLTKKQLKQDVGYLVRLWGEIAKKREGARAPDQLSSELDIVLKTARDLFTDEVDTIVIDDKREYERLVRFVDMFMPERLKDVVYYGGDEPIFDAYGIEDEIARALSRKVPLPSGGHLIIDQAEALTAIDVNTGRFVGKGSKDMEETILKTNIEAVQEIAYQLRFRNIGGLIILDLIDMEKLQNREKVRKKLEDLLLKDKAKTTLNRISDLGLIEMTRKRTRESLGRLLHEPCFYCDGTGQLQSKETVAYEILREIRRKRNDLPGYTVLVNCHPAVADVLSTNEKNAVADAENRFMRKITVVPRKEYHYEQFDLVGK